MYFVLVYDQQQRAVRKLEPYPGSAAEGALARRFELEREYREQPELEVVLLGAESEADLRRTHARYFKSLQELAAAS